MRYFVSILLAGLALGILPEKSQAFYPRGYYGRSYWVNPYYPSASFGAAYASPYGYQTFYNFGTYPGTYGYNSFSNSGTFIRPYVTGPFHSVYFNPFFNSYQYSSGYLNTPRFFFSYGFPY